MLLLEAVVVSMWSGGFAFYPQVDRLSAGQDLCVVAKIRESPAQPHKAGVEVSNQLSLDTFNFMAVNSLALQAGQVDPFAPISASLIA